MKHQWRKNTLIISIFCSYCPSEFSAQTAHYLGPAAHVSTLQDEAFCRFSPLGSAKAGFSQSSLWDLAGPVSPLRHQG